MRGSQGGTNQGIQGNVTADVVAVGKNARATKTVRMAGAEQAELAAAMEQLGKAIAAMPVSAEARGMLAKDVGALREAVAGEEPAKAGGVLERINGKLKMLGEVGMSVAEVMAPLVKIAGILHLPAAVLGLL